jgi:hypothetical protein
MIKSEVHMTTLYKLTRQDNTTTGGITLTLTWGAGVSNTATGSGTRLCSPDVIHAYTHPLLAVLLNPIHANYDSPKLWRCEGDIVADDHGLKVGVKTLTTIEEIPLPAVTTEQRVKFAILCAKQVCKDKKWNAWADKWLSGKDRSGDAAWAAAQAPTWAASWAAASWAEAAAAARWAAEAVEAAAWEAEVAVQAKPINLIALAEQAVS